MYLFDVDWYEISNFKSSQVAVNEYTKREEEQETDTKDKEEEEIYTRVQAKLVDVNVLHRRFDHPKNLAESDVVGKGEINN